MADSNPSAGGTPIVTSDDELESQIAEIVDAGLAALMDAVLARGAGAIAASRPGPGPKGQ